MGTPSLPDGCRPGSPGKHCEEVDQSLSVFRPALMALSRSLPEEELIAVENNFYTLLNFYQANVLENIPIPMIIARRTGEIYAANEPACKLSNSQIAL